MNGPELRARPVGAGQGLVLEQIAMLLNRDVLQIPMLSHALCGKPASTRRVDARGHAFPGHAPGGNSGSTRNIGAGAPESSLTGWRPQERRLGHRPVTTRLSRRG
jgi:hypothetical protein